MNIYWIFIILFLFCIYVLFGLNITKGLEATTQIVLTWVVYTILWLTALNIFSIGYFWSVIIKKTGPYGIRGPIGEMGIRGMDGACQVNAAKLYCMKIVNNYINDLYKEKTNRDILNVDTQTFPCNYLNEKIQTLAGSRQYDVVVADLSNDGKSIDNIINYIKSIWKTWFTLIYNATAVPGIWFTDEYADESGGDDYDWVGNNPFDEIKKYDIYYWGITRDFRPLVAELCRSNSTYGDSKFPKHNLPQKFKEKQVQRLKVIVTNDYDKTGDTRNGDDNHEGSWWTPKVQKIGEETYYPVGDVMAKEDNDAKKTEGTFVGDINKGYSSTNGPDIKTILVTGDVVDPYGYIFAADPHAYWKTARISTPICPEGYTSLGDVSLSRDYPKYNQYKCVPTDCVEEIAPGPLHKQGDEDDPLRWERKNKYFGWDLRYHRTWYSSIHWLNHWMSGDNEPNTKNGYNLMRGNESLGEETDDGDNKHGHPWYKLKKHCLVKTPNRESAPLPQIPASGIREVEEINADLGIGWYGHPYKLDPKYSIFSFLNLVPEGMIVNQGTGHRFYIVHTEGFDINLFNIFTYNNNTAKFDGSLQINYNNIDDPNDMNIPNNKKYPNNSNIPSNLVDLNEPTPEPVNFNPPPKRIIVTKLDPTNSTQQWKIMLSPDKKLFKMKNIYNSKYLIITQEPREGLIEFSSIDLNNNNYLNDPAFNDLDSNELENRTNFSFIPSFGTHLDIIERDDNNTTNN